jgi:hypothetical protein
MGSLSSGPHRSSRLHESQAKRFDVLELAGHAKTENWPDGTTRTLSFTLPHTGAVCSAKVELTFTEERFGGRRIWFRCPECGRRVRFLFGGRLSTGKPHRIACRRPCQGLAYACQLEARERRWRRQLAKLERRHRHYVGKLTEHRQARLRTKMRNRLWPTDREELAVLMQSVGLDRAGHLSAVAAPNAEPPLSK